MQNTFSNYICIKFLPVRNSNYLLLESCIRYQHSIVYRLIIKFHRFTINYTEESLETPIEITKSCGPVNFTLMLISIVYAGVLLLVASVLGWDCRKLPDNFKVQDIGPKINKLQFETVSSIQCSFSFCVHRKLYMICWRIVNFRISSFTCFWNWKRWLTEIMTIFSGEHAHFPVFSYLTSLDCSICSCNAHNGRIHTGTDRLNKWNFLSRFSTGGNFTPRQFD